MTNAENLATESPRRQRGGRRGRRGDAATELKAVGPSPLRHIRNPYPPFAIFSEDEIEAIHRTSLQILEEIGIKALLPEAREIYRRAGAEVDEGEQRVRLDGALVEQTIASIPSRVRLTPRNPERWVEVGEDAIGIVTTGGPPHATDLERGRRGGTLSDFEDFMRLAQSFEIIHIIGSPVEPMDVEVRVRHLALTNAALSLTDKVPFVYSRGPQAVADSLEMIRIARGLDEAALMQSPSCYTVVNANSPLQLDVPMSQGIIDFARMGQLMILTPFTLAGAMAPVSLPGALAQQNAEALAGLVLSQLVRPGAPVAYGGFTSNVDMKSGAPAFGTPEYAKAALISGQLARRYRVPFRSSNVNASNAPDVQAAYESQMSLWSALLGGCNILMHGAGWLEGGLSASYEKFIIDVEMLQMMAAFFVPERVDEASLALEAVREVGPGGHYFGAQHTLARYDTAFYAPLLSDWRNFESWRDAGSVDATSRAHNIYKKTLADYEAPPMDPAIREELDAFIARRTEEGGADTE